MESSVAPNTNQSNESAQTPTPDRVRIISTPGIRGGRPRIDGHRITVDDVAVWHERLGMSPDEIVSAYPSITLSDVHAALAYYYEHREQVDTAIREGEEFALEMKAKAPPSLLRQKVLHRGADATDDSDSPR